MNHRECPHCQHLNNTTSSLCGMCGAALDAEPAGEASEWTTTFGQTEQPTPAPFEGEAVGFEHGDAHLVAPFESVGDVLWPTFRLYRENFGLIAKIVFAAGVPMAVVQSALPHALPDLEASWALKAFQYVTNVFISGALVYAIAALLRRGVNPTVEEAYRRTASRFVEILVCSFIFSVITVLGSLLIIPGIVLSLIYALVIPVVVLEGRGVKHAFNRSNELTSGYRWRILGTHFLVGVVTALTGMALSLSLARSPEAQDSTLLVLLVTLTMQLLTSASTVLSVFIYFGILAHKEHGHSVGQITTLKLER